MPIEETKKNFGIALSAAIASCLCSAVRADEHDAGNRFVSKYPTASLISNADSDYCYIAHGFATSPLAGDIAEGAKKFLEEHAELFGLAGPSTELKPDKIVPHLKSRYVRFRQYMGDLPVFNSMIIVHVDAKKRIVKISSKAANIEPKKRNTVLDEIQARALATAEFPDAAALGPVLQGYYSIHGKPILVFRVVSKTPGHLWVSYVNALTGAIVMRHDEVKRHSANVYLENPVTTPDLAAVELQNIVTEGEHVNHTYGDYARTATCTASIDDGWTCTAFEHFAEADVDAGFTGVEPELDGTVFNDGFAEVQTYYAVDYMNQWFRNEFGFDGQFGDYESDSDKPVQADYIWVLVNMDFFNCYMSGGTDWSGDEQPYSISMGRFGSKDPSYDNEIVMHEFTHAISSKAFNIRWLDLDEYGVDMSGGGIEEGTADYFPVSVSETPQLAEYTDVLGRTADNDNVCPDDMIGEGHNDGQIISGAMWEIREELGKRKADHLYYGALAGNSTNGFTDLGNALVAQAEWMAGEDNGLDADLVFTSDDVAFVESIMASRNIIDCKRYIFMKEGETAIHSSSLGTMISTGAPSMFQYVVETGSSTGGFKLNISPLQSKKYDVLMRRGAPVTFTWSGSGMDSAWTAEYDAEWQYEGATGTAVTSIELSNDSEPEIEPNTEYYFSIICATTAWSEVCHNEVSVSYYEYTDGGPDDESDSGADSGADSDSDADTDTSTDTETADGGEVNKESGGCGCEIGISATIRSHGILNLVSVLFP